MQNELAYERLVTDLERKYRTRIATWAAQAVRGKGTDDQLDATDEVEAKLLGSSDWAKVAATDISDVAYEAVSDAFNARWA